MGETLVTQTIRILPFALAAIGFWLLTHTPWYSAILFGFLLWGCLWIYEAAQKENIRKAAWLAIVVSIQESRHISDLQGAISNRNLVEINSIKEKLMSSMHELQ